MNKEFKDLLDRLPQLEWARRPNENKKGPAQVLKPIELAPISINKIKSRKALDEPNLEALDSAKHALELVKEALETIGKEVEAYKNKKIWKEWLSNALRDNEKDFATINKLNKNAKVSNQDVSKIKTIITNAIKVIDDISRRYLELNKSDIAVAKDQAKIPVERDKNKNLVHNDLLSAGLKSLKTVQRKDDENQETNQLRFEPKNAPVQTAPAALPAQDAPNISSDLAAQIRNRVRAADNQSAIKSEVPLASENQGPKDNQADQDPVQDEQQPPPLPPSRLFDPAIPPPTGWYNPHAQAETPLPSQSTGASLKKPHAPIKPIVPPPPGLGASGASPWESVTPKNSNAQKPLPPSARNKVLGQLVNRNGVNTNSDENAAKSVAGSLMATGSSPVGKATVAIRKDSTTSLDPSRADPTDQDRKGQSILANAQTAASNALDGSKAFAAGAIGIGTGLGVIVAGATSAASEKVSALRKTASERTNAASERYGALKNRAQEAMRTKRRANRPQDENSDPNQQSAMQSQPRTYIKPPTMYSAASGNGVQDSAQPQTEQSFVNILMSQEVADSLPAPLGEADQLHFIGVKSQGVSRATLKNPSEPSRVYATFDDVVDKHGEAIAESKDVLNVTYSTIIALNAVQKATGQRHVMFEPEVGGQKISTPEQAHQYLLGVWDACRALEGENWNAQEPIDLLRKHDVRVKNPSPEFIGAIKAYLKESKTPLGDQVMKAAFKEYLLKPAPTQTDKSKLNLKPPVEQSKPVKRNAGMCTDAALKAAKERTAAFPKNNPPNLTKNGFWI